MTTLISTETRLSGLNPAPQALWTVLVVLTLHLALVQPNHPDALHAGALLFFPLELPAVVLALIAFGDARAGFAFRLCLIAILACVSALKGTDFIMNLALSRGFNLVADSPLIASFWGLVVDTTGPIVAAAAVAAAGLAMAGFVAALWWACGRMARLPASRTARRVAGGAALLASATAAAAAGATPFDWSTPIAYPRVPFTPRLGGAPRLDAPQTHAAPPAISQEVSKSPSPPPDGAR